MDHTNRNRRPKNKKIRETIVHDGSSYISIAIWENINLTNDDYYYEITDAIVSDYYHKKIKTSMLSGVIRKNTLISNNIG